MSTRTTRFIVRFSSPFLLRGLETRQPPGTYRIEQDEELIDGLSRVAYRRVATFLHLPAVDAQSLTSQVVQIDPTELDAALEKDHQAA